MTNFRTHSGPLVKTFAHRWSLWWIIWVWTPEKENYKTKNHPLWYLSCCTCSCHVSKLADTTEASTLTCATGSPALVECIKCSLFHSHFVVRGTTHCNLAVALNVTAIQALVHPGRARVIRDTATHASRTLARVKLKDACKRAAAVVVGLPSLTACCQRRYDPAVNSVKHESVGGITIPTAAYAACAHSRGGATSPNNIYKNTACKPWCFLSDLARVQNKPRTSRLDGRVGRHFGALCDVMKGYCPESYTFLQS